MWLSEISSLFEGGKITAKVALLGTNAVIAAGYPTETYVQFKNAREVAEIQGLWQTIA